MRIIPENQRDIKELLYEQVPMLIEKLKTCDAKDSLCVVKAILEISQIGSK